jgi:hypothetical protein
MGVLRKIIQESVECLRRKGETIRHIEYKVVGIGGRDQFFVLKGLGIVKHGKVKNAEEGFYLSLLKLLGIKPDIGDWILINTAKEIDGAQV